MKTRVLHAEDDEMVRRVMAQVLQRFGWEVTSVAGGAEALICAAEAPFDVVITDHEMPRGDGLALVAGLRAAHFTGRIYVLAGGLSAAARREYRRMEVDGIAAKPISLEELRSLLLRDESDPNVGRWSLQVAGA